MDPTGRRHGGRGRRMNETIGSILGDVVPFRGAEHGFHFPLLILLNSEVHDTRLFYMETQADVSARTAIG
jgi:hypothetical protein